MFKTHAPLLVVLILVIALPAASQLLEPEPTSRKYEDRAEIPGHYTVGFYSDDRGSSETLKIAKDATEFEVWLGVTGDSTRVFSGLAMSIDLPYGVELGGPIVWAPRPGLETTGSLLSPGVIVGFPQDCARQTGSAPLILARIPLTILPGLNDAVVAPKEHRAHGLSVELCQHELAWPKPYAEAVSLKVQRKLSLWDRITGLFD